MRLLLISCSDTKTDAPGEIPALDRYDGPKYRVLRGALKSSPADPPRIRILSGKLGWIAPECRIPAYDHLGGWSEIARHCSFRNAPHTYMLIDQSTDIFVMAGGDYLRGIKCMLGPQAAICAEGPPGKRLQQLKEWLLK